MFKQIPVALFLSAVAANYLEDKVDDLPGMGEFNDFGFFSGYLDIKSSVLNFYSSKHLHYVLAKSQRDPENDPLIVWFNGGPGCSSMFGLLQEHGPYVMEDNSTEFKVNEWSWNKEASVLYIESPAGVGYSYCDSTRYCVSSDDSSSLDNLEAMLSFFKKFPEFQKNDLYLSGESYAGIYVPFLAWRMHEYNIWLNHSSSSQHLQEERFLGVSENINGHYSLEQKYSV